MKSNPVYKREVTVRARSFRMPLIILVFNGILAVVALLNMYSAVAQVRISASVQYSSFLQLYAFVATLEFLLLMFIMPALTSGSISGTLPNATPNDSFDWSSVPAVFRNTGIQNYSRDHSGAAKSVYYTEAAARNNIQEVRVTKDSENLYFYILCENDITPYDGKNNWMNLFIGTGELTEKGWNGYEYVVNRHVNGSVSEVTALSADFSGSKAGEASLHISGAAMVVTVPRSAIGLSDNDNNFYFKVSDHITSPSDIMDYYVSGRSLPMGRLSFRYVG